MEQWKAIQGWEEIYEISNYGNVRSIDRYINYPDGHKQFVKGKQLFLNTVNSGYQQVTLYKKSKPHKYYVHQLVAQAFVSNPNHHSEIHHKDYNKQNNHADNLMWITHLDNIIDLQNHKNPQTGYKDSHNRFKSHKCADCGKIIRYKSTWCKQCAAKHIKHHYKNKVLSKKEIKIALIETKGNFTLASKRFDMTDNSLRKWCRKYNIPTHSKEWKELLKERSKI